MVEYITFYLSIYQLMYIWVVFTFLVIMNMLLWTFVWVFEWHMFSFSWGLYLWVELLGCVVTSCLPSRGTVFQGSYITVHSINHWWGLNFSISLPTLTLFYFSHPSRLEVVSHCDFQMTIDVIFSCAYWLFPYLLWSCSLCCVCVHASTRTHSVAELWFMITHIVLLTRFYERELVSTLSSWKSCTATLSWFVISLLNTDCCVPLFPGWLLTLGSTVWFEVYTCNCKWPMNVFL